VARYYLHLHECGTIAQDCEGFDLPGLAEATVVAIDAARDIMAAEVMAGELCLACFIAVEDEGGNEVARIPFRQALRLTGL
jgi:hypothetical protein